MKRMFKIFKRKECPECPEYEKVIKILNDTIKGMGEQVGDMLDELSELKFDDKLNAKWEKDSAHKVVERMKKEDDLEANIFFRQAFIALVERLRNELINASKEKPEEEQIKKENIKGDKTNG